MNQLKDLGPIAIDARMIHHSGIGVVLRQLLRHWAETEHPTLHLYGNPDQILQSLPDGIDAEVFQWEPKLYSITSLLSPPLLQPGTQAWFSAHYATCLRPTVPLVTFVQDVLHITHPPRPGTKPFMQGCLSRLRQRASFILAPSRHVKVQLQTLHGFEAHRVLHAPLGPGPIASVDASIDNLPKPLRNIDYILSIGIYKPHKNWLFLLDRIAAMPEVAETLVCLGLGNEKEELLKAARARGIDSDRILVLDYLEKEELAAAYHGARALVHPSLAEGFGMPILEGLSAGIPVIHADRSPMKEISGNAGFAFDPDWPATFDNALKTALYDVDARSKAIRIGRDRAALYSWATAASIIEHALFRTITGELPPS